jgi:hypothetical protein
MRMSALLPALLRSYFQKLIHSWKRMEPAASLLEPCSVLRRRSKELVFVMKSHEIDKISIVVYG